MRFDALLLIDVCDQDWARREGAVRHSQFVARLLDYVDCLQFDRVLFSNNMPTHPWVVSAFPSAVAVSSLDDIQVQLPYHSSILVGGTSWQGCLHKNPVCFRSLAASTQPDWQGGYNVFSSPHIVDSHHLSGVTITHDHFAEDALPWRRVFDYWLLSAGSVHVKSGPAVRP